MKRLHVLQFAFTFVTSCSIALAAPFGAEVVFTEDERRTILSHGPWPPRLVRDSSNYVSGNIAAIALGRRLFFDSRLSISNTISCATCHEPGKAFSDGKPLAHGLAQVPRNTPSVWNVRFNRWYGWSGATDTLWGASIRPILIESEMGASEGHVANLIANDATLEKFFQNAFRKAPDQLSAEQTFVGAGKALAAYQETLVTPRTAFDDFRDSIAKGNDQQQSSYSLSEQRGLKIFVGKGNCSLCHFGPSFTNGEFDDVAIPFFSGPGVVDQGRYGGIKSFRRSPYTRSGVHSDNPDRKALTRHVALKHRNWGEFKVPSLRNVARTAPYMHNGSLATLRDVVLHYSKIDEERLHSDGNTILKPLNLTSEEVEDLISFLDSLTSPE